MPEPLKFNDEIIPVAHLMPDDVLVFSIPEPLPEDELERQRQMLRELFPLPRRTLVMDSGISLTVGRNGVAVPLGES